MAAEIYKNDNFLPIKGNIFQNVLKVTPKPLLEGLSKRKQIVIYSEKRSIWLRGSPSRKISTMDLRSDPQNLGFLWITESAGKKAQRDTLSLQTHSTE